MYILSSFMVEVLSEVIVKKDNEMGSNIPGGNFLGGNFPGMNFPGGSLMGGNFPGENFLRRNVPRTIYKQVLFLVRVCKGNIFFKKTIAFYDYLK